MANPQKENGYTVIANEILDVVIKIPLNGTQFRILLKVWRDTYGFNRKEHKLSLSYLSEGLNVKKRALQREIKYLIDNKILIVVKDAEFSTSRIIAFNKDYDAWFSQQVTDTSTGDGLDTSTGDGLDTSTGDGLDTQQRKTKERTKETLSLCVRTREVFKYIATTDYLVSLNNTQRQAIEKFISEDGFDADVIISVLKEKALAGKPVGHAILKLNDLLQARVFTMADYEKLINKPSTQKQTGTKFNNFTPREKDALQYDKLGVYIGKDD